jgi:large subunit ribosomal protein L17
MAQISLVLEPVASKSIVDDAVATATKAAKAAVAEDKAEETTEA